MTEQYDIDSTIRSLAADWFARQRSGAMSETEREQLEQWLEADERHRLAFSQCQTLWLMSDELSDDLTLREECHMAKQGRASYSRRGLRWRHWVQAAAVVIIALAVVFVNGDFFVEDYQTGVGEQRMVRLEDGSTVMLNTSTRVAVRYNQGGRRIDLERGEAFFNVSKNPQRPFVVHARGSRVRAVGTAFNVALKPKSLDVAVTQGIVGVSAPSGGGDDPENLARLTQGQGVSFMPGKDHTLQSQSVDLEKVTAWQARKIYFDNDRLEDAIDEYNRYIHRQILLVGDGLANERISGIFNIGDTDALLFALRESLGARVEVNDKRILVLEPRSHP